MNILYIHQYFATREGSTGTRSYEFAKYFVKKGHQVVVLTGDSFLSNFTPLKETRLTKEYEIDGIRVIAIKVNYSNYMNYFQRMLSFVKFMAYSSVTALGIKGIDLVFATSTPLTVAVPALLMKWFRKKPYIFEVRDLWPEAPVQIGAIKSRPLIRLLRWFEKLTYRNAENIIALSPGMEEGVISTGISSNKVFMVPNCSDLDLFDPNDDDETFRIRYDLEGKLVVAHGGSMGIANGLEYIIQAAKILQDLQEKRIVFILAGGGKTKPDLEKVAMQHRLTNVIFTDSLARTEMPKVLACSDITMTCFKNIPILATNSPNKFFDSLAAGKPVIVNSPGWTKDIVERHGIGFYVDPERPEDLANLLIQIQEKRDELKRMGAKARALAEREYDRMLLAERVEKIIQGVGAKK